MNELSLFSGAGGGLLGSKLLGWRTIGYVEKDEYCQKIIAQRIRDGMLDLAPIFCDIRAFASEGFARQYRGVAEIITAGFPCQPFSHAGSRKGAADERNMWPATIACIREVRPAFALLENVPGLLTSGYFGTVLGGLAEAGYHAEWSLFGASDVGAHHRRKRLWIKAVRQGDAPRANANGSGSHRAQINLEGKAQLRDQQNGKSGPLCKDVGDSAGKRLPAGMLERIAPSNGNASHAGGWAVEPNVGRVANGVASRVDRLKALGNGQVPRVVEVVWRLMNHD